VRFPVVDMEDGVEEGWKGSPGMEGAYRRLSL
jgi:hypothetical protein